MGFLEELLDEPTLPRYFGKGYKGSGYLPFTEARYIGRFAMPEARYDDFISNVLKFSTLVGYSSNTLRSQASVNKLSLIEDRRKWRPSEDVTLDLSGRQVVPTDVSDTPVYSFPDWIADPYSPDPLTGREHPFKRYGSLSTNLKNAPWWYGFANANKVVICIKRKIRREVLNALGIAGSTVGKPHFNMYSKVKC